MTLDHEMFTFFKTTGMFNDFGHHFFQACQHQKRFILPLTLHGRPCAHIKLLIKAWVTFNYTVYTCTLVPRSGQIWYLARRPFGGSGARHRSSESGPEPAGWWDLTRLPWSLCGQKANPQGTVATGESRTQRYQIKRVKSSKIERCAYLTSGRIRCWQVSS